MALEDIADPCLHIDVAATDTIYDGSNAVRDLNGVSGALGDIYVHGAGVDEIVAWYDAGTGATAGWNLPVADYAGSTVAIQQQGGTTAPAPENIFTYSAYGEVNNTSGFPFRYTGRRLDAETGLYYYRARYYSSILGRFLQTDPIGYGDNMNMYAYVANDPVNYADHTGKSATLTGAGAGCAATGPACPIGATIGGIGGAIVDIAIVIGVGVIITDLIDEITSDDGGDAGNGGDGRELSTNDNGGPELNDPDNGGPEKPGLAPLPPSRELGDRFRSTDDPHQQHEEIERTQREGRQGKGNDNIDSIKKSKQRSDNDLRRRRGPVRPGDKEDDSGDEDWQDIWEEKK